MCQNNTVQISVKLKLLYLKYNARYENAKDAD